MALRDKSISWRKVFSDGGGSSMRALLAGGLVSLAAMTPPAGAADKIWMTDNGEWNVAENWSPTGVPGTADDAYIVNGLTARLETTPASAAHRLYVGSTFDQGGSTTGSGTFNQTGGDLRLVGPQSWLVMGDKPEATPSTYNLSGGSLFIEDDYMTVAQGGTANLNVSGTGSIDTRGLNVGRWAPGPGRNPAIIAPSVGTVTLKDSGVIKTRVGGFAVGLEGTGTFTQEGGTVDVDGSGGTTPANALHWAYVGGRDNDKGPRTGTYNMQGGSFRSRERLQIGQGGGSNGTFNHTGGDVVVGTLNPDGTTPGPEGNVEIGVGGIGTYNLSNGNFTSRRNVVVGAWQGGDGRLNVSGGTMNIGEGLMISRGSLSVVDRADPVGGVVTQTGGAITSAWADVGTDRFPGATHVGRYKMVDGTLSTRFEINVGRTFGEGVFEMSGGTVNVGTGGGTRQFIVGRGGGTGTLLMSGGTINIPDAFMLSSAEGNPARIGTGTGTQTGGTIISGSWVSIGQHGKAVYNLSGGELRATGDFNIGDVVAGTNPGSDGTLNLSGTGLARGANVFVGKAGGTKGLVDQTGGTFRVGAGGMTIAPQANSTGIYNLKGGVLEGEFESTMRFGAGSAEFNMTGGTLKKFGLVEFPLNNEGGRVVVGDEGTASGVVGPMTVNSGYTQNSAGSLALDIVNANSNDYLNVNNGTATLAGNLSLTKDPLYEPQVGQTLFAVATTGGVIGRFDTITGNQASPTDPPSPNLRFAPKYNPNDVQLVVTYAGDADLDLNVGFDDFQQLERNFGGLNRDWSEGDFTGDGRVTFEDFQLLFENFGQSSTPIAGISPSDQASLDAFFASNVPEPGLAVLGSLGALCVLARRRGR